MVTATELSAFSTKKKPHAPGGLNTSLLAHAISGIGFRHWAAMLAVTAYPHSLAESGTYRHE